MGNLIGAKAREDYEAFLYTGPNEQLINLCLHFNHEFLGLPHKFQDFCTSNNIACEVIQYEPPEFRFRFQNTEVCIEHNLSKEQRFYLGTYLIHGREFVNFYRMFKLFFEDYQLNLSPVDDLIFSEKLQGLIRKGDEKLVGRITPAYSAPVKETAQVYEEMELAVQKLITDVDEEFKRKLLTNTGIDLYNALRKRDDGRAERLMGEYVRIASELDIDPRPGLESILNSV